MTLEEEAFYNAYLAIFRLPVSLTQRNSALTTVMGAFPGSWAVVGVTPAALKLYASHSFRPPGKMQLARGHIVDRIVRARQLLECSSPLPMDEFFRLFFENDKVVLMLKGENKQPVPPYLPVDPARGLFQNGMLLGHRHKRMETEFLRELERKWKEGEIEPVTAESARVNVVSDVPPA